MLVLLSMRWPAGSRECASKDACKERGARDAVHANLNSDMRGILPFRERLGSNAAFFFFHGDDLVGGDVLSD